MDGWVGGCGWMGGWVGVDGWVGGCGSVHTDFAIGCTFVSNYGNLYLFTGMATFIRPDSQIVAPGDMVRFYGSAAIAIPSPTVTWEMNGIMLQDGDRTSRVSIFPSGALHIENVTQQDEGRYMLQLTNGYRVRKFDVTLRIKESMHFYLLVLVFSEMQYECVDDVNEQLAVASICLFLMYLCSFGCFCVYVYSGL